MFFSGLASEHCSKGYENMIKNLSVLKKEPEKPSENRSNNSNNNNNKSIFPPKNSNLVTPYRYQTITFETLGYSGSSVDVRPYGLAKYHFVAEFDNELGLNEGDMVYLIRYVDNEWMEVEIDSNRR